MNDLLAVYEAVCSHLEPALTAAGAVMFRGEVPEAEDAPRLPDGQLIPYACVFLSTPDEGPTPGIVGVQYDLLSTEGLVLCAAETYGNCLALVGLVHRNLHGFRLPDSSELVCFGSAQRNPVPDLMHPARYAQTVGFGMSIGAQVVVP